MQPERLSDNTLDTIPFDCTSNLSVHADSEPAVTKNIRAVYQCKTIAMQTLTLTVHPVKLPSFSQKRAFTQLKFPQLFRQKASSCPLLYGN